MPGQAEALEQLRPRNRIAVEGRDEFHRLPDLELVGVPALLQLGAEPLPDLGGVPFRIQAEDPDPPLVGRAKTFDGLDDGGLAGPVRAPRIPKISPSSTVSETSSTTAVPAYRLTRCSTSMADMATSSHRSRNAEVSLSEGRARHIEWTATSVCADGWWRGPPFG